MNVDEEERRPLLGSSTSDGQEPAQDADLHPKDSAISSGLSKIRERWHVYRVLIVALLMYISNVGPIAVLIELSRALSCAEYYELFPGAIDGQTAAAAGGDVCDNPWIERRSAQALSIIDVSGSLFATLAIFLIQPHLQRWGAKNVLIIGIALLFLDRTANLFWPLGYPYRPSDAPAMAISAVNVRRAFILVECLASLMGGELVPVMCLRLIMSKVSSANDRTANLVNLQLMNMISISVGPTLTVWLGSLFPLSSTRTDYVLLSIGHFLQHHLRSGNAVQAVNTLTTTTPPIIPPNIPRVEPTNIAPYLISLATVTVTVLAAVLLLPSDQVRAASDVAEREEIQADGERAAVGTKRESMFYRVWPRRDVDGQLDWRIAVMCLTAMCHLATAYSLNIFLQFFGHALKWGQESVAALISAMGISRMVCLITIVPLVSAYYQRAVRRPSPLRGLTLDQIKAVARCAPADEPPMESAFEVEPQSRPEDLRGAVSTWQALVDRGVLKFSLIADIVGWFLTALFTATGNATMIAVSGCVSALGAASVPVRMGVDLVIMGDVLARTAEHHSDAGSTDPNPTAAAAHLDPAYAQELYFSLIGFFDCIATFLSPIFDTWVYGLTLDTFPAINWLIACAWYTITFLLHFSMPIHRRGQRRRT